MSRDKQSGFTPFTSFLRTHDGPEVYSSYDPLKLKEEAIARAQTEAEKIILKARAEAEAVTAKAREEGRSLGLKEGLNEFNRSNQAQIEILQHLFREIQNKFAQIDHLVARDEIMGLILVMVDRLVNKAILQNERIIEVVLQQAMDFVVENTNVRVNLNPDDFNFLRESSLDNPEFLAGLTRIQLVEDPEISRGGCLLTTDFGEIDATLENRRSRLVAVVERAFVEVEKNNAAGLNDIS
ncbi:MAG: hypothetical protein KJ950_02830 [Proteobacteria bacterium]|nr:hypothetical protein [Pseudomonadota bacterium]MBU1686810.1 hypothetical protein [Pseudomonadota bacterium]